MGIESSKFTESEVDSDELEGHYGYRIMKLLENGSGMRAGLRVYEDFIVAVDDLIVEEEEERIPEYLKEKTGQQVKLVVWNCLDEEEREVVLVVNKPTKDMGYLGVIVRYESLFQAAEYSWHVISVVPNSPADEVGLMPQSDYIVGTPSVAFRSYDTLPQLVYDAAHLQNSLDLMVWSKATGKVRLISVEPEITEEGTPLLGCELAKGLLHQLPRRNTSKTLTRYIKQAETTETPNTLDSEESNESSTKDTTYSNSIDTTNEEFYDTRSPSSFEARNLEQSED
ncbi:Golgi reassembly-stacking protein 1 [Galdieria sulphuraria]|nr:Golgi reassembly-stacking protein 1 [Galdieria sulphuraria]